MTEAPKTPKVETPPTEVIEFISEIPMSAIVVAVALGITLGVAAYWLVTHITVEDDRRA